MNRYVIMTGRDEYIIDTDDLEIAEKILVSTKDPEAYIRDMDTGQVST